MSVIKYALTKTLLIRGKGSVTPPADISTKNCHSTVPLITG